MKKLCDKLQQGFKSNPSEAVDFMYDDCDYNQLKYKQYFRRIRGLECVQEVEVAELIEKNNNSNVAYVLIRWVEDQSIMKFFDDMIDAYQAMNELDDALLTTHALLDEWQIQE